MLKRIQKSILTKRIRKHLKKCHVVRFRFNDISMYIVPGSDKVTCVFNSQIQEALSPPRVSDYIVENGHFDSFWALFKEY